MNKSNIIFLLSIYCVICNGQDITDGARKNVNKRRSPISDVTNESQNKGSLPGPKEVESNKSPQFKHVDTSRRPGGLEMLMSSFPTFKSNW